MKHLLAIAFITLLTLGTGCAWISPSSQTTSDGIQVHGHWTVTVTNPDGTVDAVHEFDNSLDVAGRALLSAFLVSPTINIDQSTWSIILSGSSGPDKSLNDGLDCTEQKDLPEASMAVMLPANAEKVTSSPEIPSPLVTACKKRPF